MPSFFSDRKKLSFILMPLAYFFVMWGYSFFHSTVTALYIHHEGADKTPLVSFLSIFALIASVSLFNQLQKRYAVQFLFLLINLLSLLFFLPAPYMLSHFGDMAFYLVYIWKEIYVVFLVHMIWAYANNLFPLQEAKLFFGPMAAFGSLGAIVGGFIVSYLSRTIGTESTLMVGCIGLLLAALLFWYTLRLENEKEDKKNYQSPLQSVSNIKSFVFLIIVLVCCSQFFINIVTFQFNMNLEAAVVDMNEKTSYLAQTFSWINSISFVCKLFLMPFLLKVVSHRTVHFFIPLFYALVSMIGMGSSVAFEMLAISYVGIKGVDYSCFAVAKELLYSKLSPIQKYGAKYLSDMLFYRVAKAIVSLVLIYYQNLRVLNMANMVILGVWGGAIYILFRLEEKLPVSRP